MKDSLMQDVTHELKTPVAKQGMQLEILKRTLEKHRLDEECQKIINIMDSSVRRQESVIRNMLNLSRLEAGGRKYQIAPLLLDAVLEEVMSDYGAMIEMRGIKVEHDLQAVTIHSDKEMLFHVFSNLFNNAVKYRTKQNSPRIQISFEEKEDWVITRIQDNGIGLSAKDTEQAFDKFYQASASADGSGVGLTIAKKIIIELGGEIHLESAGKDKGATAIVKLPRKITEAKTWNYKI